MNTEQKYTVDQAEGQVRQARRTLSELEGYGWKPAETTKPLQAFDAYRGRLAANQAAIENCSPLEKDYQQKISKLLSEESLLTEGLGKLAGEAAAALADEELSFFEARAGLLTGLNEQVSEADTQIQQALTWLIEGLQSRWEIMQKKQELSGRFQAISQAHNTAEGFGVTSLQIGKPFPKMAHAVWGAYVGSFFGRVQTVFGNCEATSPQDTVRTVYEK